MIAASLCCLALVALLVPTQPASAQDGLTLTKTVDNPTPGQGDRIMFFLEIPCTEAGAVTVIDELPAGLAFTGGFSTTNGAADIDEQTFTWTPNPNPAFATTSFCPARAEFGVAVDASASGSITNTATVGDLTASATIEVTEVAFEVFKTVDVGAAVEGDTVLFTITIACDLNIDTVTVTDQFPAGILIGSYSTNNGTAERDDATSTFTWQPRLRTGLPEESCPAEASVEGFISEATGTVTNTVTATDGGVFNAEASVDVFTTQVGDVDCDGEITLQDARNTALFAIGVYADTVECPLPGLAFAFSRAGDMDLEGGVTLQDARHIARCAIGVQGPSCITPPA